MQVLQGRDERGRCDNTAERIREEKMRVGTKIREIRTAKGWTQETLAEKLGMNQIMISQYENGGRNPKISTLKKFAEALDVPLEEFAQCYLGSGDEPLARHIGNKLAEARVAKGMSQTDVASKLNVTRQNISQYERGERIPKISTLENLATALNVPMETLMPDRRERMKLIKLTTLTGKQIYINPAYLCAVGSKPAYHVEHGEVITDTGTQTVLTFIGGSITVKEPLNEVIEKVCGEQC